jgi:hypothetical protein
MRFPLPGSSGAVSKDSWWPAGVQACTGLFPGWACRHARRRLPVDPYNPLARRKAGICLESYLYRLVQACSPRKKSHHAGRLLAAERSAEALVPFRDSTFTQSLPDAWVVTRKTEARVRVSPCSVGTKHPGRSCLTIPPHPAHEHHPSHTIILCRVPPRGRTP